MNAITYDTLANRHQILPNAIYTTREAAELTKVKPSTIRTYVRLGRIKGMGRPFRIRGSELFKLAGVLT
jgi:excisionase family DNA binding protein